MKNIKDITGQKFGSWTVLDRSEKKSCDGIYYWNCRCECGKIKEVRGQNLRNGNSQRCESHCPVLVYENKKKIFAKKTIKAANGCWIWIGLRNQDGYGQIGDGVYSHRFSYEMFKGKIPENMCVCHTCDNPACVNPAHLWIALKGDNNRDRSQKNRSALGENNGKSKLNEKLVRKIRISFTSGIKTKTTLAKEFNVTLSTISQIINYDTWKHVN